MTRFLLSLLCLTACSVFAADGDFSYRQGDDPAPRLLSPLPFDKKFEQLGESDKTRLRALHPGLAADCEPPFPQDGLAPIFEQLTRYQSRSGIDAAGRMAFEVDVDKAGAVTAVAITATPSPRLDKMADYILRDTAFKPARCKGEATAMKYRLAFELLAPPKSAAVERD